MSAEYTCIHEDQIQGISRKTAELEARADYKEKRIDELNNKINEMDKKLDILVQGFNDFKVDSNKGDVELELRLKTIETDYENLKASLKDKEADAQRRFNNQMTIFAFICAVITIGVNVYFNMLR
jgi:uncharacterized coiled-coil protein SlyX